MLAARTIGGVLVLAAALLTLTGARVAGAADAPRLASLARSARLVGAFLLVWLARDLAELLFARVTVRSFAHTADIACVACASVLAVSLVVVGRAMARPSWRVTLVALAVLTATSALLRLAS